MSDKTSDPKHPSAQPCPKHGQGPLCTRCKVPTRFMTSILDVSNDRSVLIFRCDDCRSEVWK